MADASIAKDFGAMRERAQAVWGAVEQPSRPQIIVGMGIHGVAAGAPDVLDAINATLKSNGVQADVYITGGLGLDYAEVIVSVIKPGQPRLFFSHMTPELANKLVVDYVVGDTPPKDLLLGATGSQIGAEVPDLFQRPEFKIQERLATANCGIIDPTNIWHYIARGGYEALHKALTTMEPAALIDEIEKSNLRGRGGAAFPAFMKWKFLYGAPGPPKYHLCNAEEGDSGAFNDKHLLESDPHRIIEGMILAGYATRASDGKGFVFIRTGWDLPITRVQKAIEDAYELGLLGQGILGADFNFDIEISLTGESYVAGEETALMESVEGKRAMPRYKPPFPAVAGVWQKPSNINNVKTYSYVPSIIQNGGDWFASIGTERSKGTALVCLTGHVNRPGLYEVPFGVTLRQVIEVAGGGVTGGKALKVLQTGGPLGGFLPASAVDMPIDFDAMIAAGAMFGSGGIIVGDETVSVVEIAQVLAEFNAEESCGKCFPCRIGTRQIADILERMQHGKGSKRELEMALVIGDTMKSSLCAHGHLAENPIKSGYRYFKEEFEAAAP
ncbi:MAG: SLBB domain-containing protein [Chloroflexi bacterium]|nr:SLBB domain-containing protein [Chloroflexota bacterium]